MRVPINTLASNAPTNSFTRNEDSTLIRLIIIPAITAATTQTSTADAPWSGRKRTITIQSDSERNARIPFITAKSGQIGKGLKILFKPHQQECLQKTPYLYSMGQRASKFS